MTKPSIVLIYPDTMNNRSDLIPPLSLIHVGAPLMGDFDVRIIDMRIDDDWRGTLTAALSAGNVLCVGVSTMTGPQIKGACEAAAIVRSAAPSVTIVWGGVHPSLLPEQTIRSELMDVLVVGDGEETFRELVTALAGGDDIGEIKGLVFKRGGEIVTTPKRGQTKIDPRVIDAYELLDMEAYKANPAWTETESLPFITSRGCPHRCGYCYNTEFCSRRWTALTAEETVDSMLELSRRYGVRGIFLLDDNFFVNTRRVRRIAELLVESGVGLSIYNGNCRADTLAQMDEGLLRLLKRAGFDQLFIGVESGSDEILKRIGKDITVDDVMAASAKLKRVGIRPFYSFMAGFPFETAEHVKDTLRLMHALLRENPNAIVYRLQLYTPFPGTELYHCALSLGMPFPETLEGWASYHYDEIGKGGFPLEHRKLLEDLHFYTAYLDKKLSAGRSPVLRMVSHLLSDMLRLRIRHSALSYMVELQPFKLGQKIRNRRLGKC
ncbi:MAG: radical SAM protein [Syntrophobacteraceae bacterium]